MKEKKDETLRLSQRKKEKYEGRCEKGGATVSADERRKWDEGVFVILL